MSVPFFFSFLFFFSRFVTLKRGARECETTAPPVPYGFVVLLSTEITLAPALRCSGCITFCVPAKCSRHVCWRRFVHIETGVFGLEWAAWGRGSGLIDSLSPAYSLGTTVLSKRITTTTYCCCFIDVWMAPWQCHFGYF